jgi:type III restriction enzyme
VLHSVSAAELDAEEMIKMPIRLETRPQWKELLRDAIQTRDKLEQLAKQERSEHGGEYIRPVMLLQAQPKNKDVTVDVLNECLKTDFRIPEQQIAIATGAKDTLTNQDVMSPDCPLRFIITVDKLREGWDCPFAYVLATVREMKSSTAIEQILGRVMRLPNARKKTIGELNRAYAFSVSDHIGPALGSLRESLVEIGFGKTEAKDMVVASPQGHEQEELFGLEGVEDCPEISVSVPEPLAVESLSQEARSMITYEEASEKIVVSAVMSTAVRKELESIYPTREGKAAVRQAFVASQKLRGTGSPVQHGAKFEVPYLCYRQGDFLEPFEDTHFIDHLWGLRKYDSALSEGEFATRKPLGETGEVFQVEGQLRTRFVSLLQGQMERLSDERGWTVALLAQWLDCVIPHRDITAEETGIFLANAIEHLVTERGIDLAELVYEKYRLRDALENKIDAHRKSAREKAFQTLLLDDSALAVDPQDPMALFSYIDSPFSYGTSNPYTGHHTFSKHFYPKVFDLKSEGEEFECAGFIDSLDGVEYWVRNIERRPEASFWLQTSSDRFYPDFVCKLRDGRILVVEYKGEDRWTNADSREKRNIGELWQERSGGNCLFVMPKGKDLQAIRAKINRS